MSRFLFCCLLCNHSFQINTQTELLTALNLFSLLNSNFFYTHYFSFKAKETELGAKVTGATTARDADSSSSFLTGGGLKKHTQKKDTKATATFRGNWTPQIGAASNQYGFSGK